MTVSLGRVLAQLAERTDQPPAALVDLVNRNVDPPAALAPDDIYIRAMYVVSDKVNSFGGRFPIEEHEVLAALLVDSPVLVGHRKDKLPVGRTFHAETVEREGVPWVKSYFYWLRSAEGAEQLKDNLDGGVYKECSIAFTFQLPECSICGQDIRRCKHEPFEEYSPSGGAQSCHFNYRQIERVLETSLVYRGAVPNTKVTRELDDHVLPAGSPELGVACAELEPLDCLEELKEGHGYLIVPHYEGLPVMAELSQGHLRLARLDGSELSTVERPRDRQSSFDARLPLFGKLVGYRGRERCRLTDLEAHLGGNASKVSRLVLHLFPNQGLVALPPDLKPGSPGLRTIPHRISSVNQLDRQAREIMTRDGVEVWSLNRDGKLFDVGRAEGYRYLPSPVPAQAENSFVCSSRDGGISFELRVASDLTGGRSTSSRVSVDRIDRVALQQGACYLTGLPKQASNVGASQVRSVRPADVRVSGEGLLIRGGDLPDGWYALRPVRLRGEDRFLIYRWRGDATQALASGLGGRHV